MTVKDHEKFTIISYHDFKIISIILMSYQKFSLYAQHMMNMIFRFHTTFNKLNCYRTEKQLYYTKILQSDKQEKIIQRKHQFSMSVNLKKKYLNSFKRFLMISIFFIIRISIDSSMLI